MSVGGPNPNLDPKLIKLVGEAIVQSAAGAAEQPEGAFPLDTELGANPNSSFVDFEPSEADIAAMFKPNTRGTKTTMAVGEEGGDIRPGTKTTMAVGEEGGGGQIRVSEKSEEDGGDQKPRITFALGEGGGSDPGTMTTKAGFEEGGSGPGTMTTMAVGEEGGGGESRFVRY